MSALAVGCGAPGSEEIGSRLLRLGRPLGWRCDQSTGGAQGESGQPRHFRLDLSAMAGELHIELCCAYGEKTVVT